MFVAEETANSRSHVTFYRCSLCVGEHVSSEPIEPIVGQDSRDWFALSGAERIRPQIA